MRLLIHRFGGGTPSKSLSIASLIMRTISVEAPKGKREATDVAGGP
jgi:hypothetical protein